MTRALQEYIARRQQKNLASLMGKLEWDESFDYKRETPIWRCRRLRPCDVWKPIK